MVELPESYTGYVMYTTTGGVLVEPSSPENTGWSRASQHSLQRVEFWWGGRKRAEVLPSSMPRGCSPYYCHTAAASTSNLSRATVVSRSFGYIDEKGHKTLTIFDENSGNARSYVGH